MNKFKIFTLIFFILFSSYSILGCIDLNNDKNNNNNIGDDFNFKGIDGLDKKLSDYRGKIVILDMWATWCSPCGYQMQELEKAYNYYDRELIEIISLDIDPRETVNMVNNYIDQFKKNGVFLDWIFGMDDEQIWEKYKINGGIPTLYIFDENGKIHYSHEGVIVFSEIPSGWPKNTITLKEKIDELI
jgi:thiol-disulfide isomerase/thioredoxin